MDWLFNFPFTIKLNTDAIDKAVRGFAAAYSAFFDGIKMTLTSFVGAINWVLSHIPWFILVALVFFSWIQGP